MFCKNCGNNLEEDSKFCNKCGIEICSENSNSIKTKTSNKNKELRSEKVVFICLFIFAVCVFVFSAMRENMHTAGIGFIATLFFCIFN